MMRVRCPACQTVFRAKPEQLHARRGAVRCGHCFNPFNALENLLDDTDDTPPAVAPTAHAPTSAAMPAVGVATAKAVPPAPPTPAAQPDAAAEDAAAAADALDFEVPEVWRSGRDTGKAEAALSPPPAERTGTDSHGKPSAQVEPALPGKLPAVVSSGRLPRAEPVSAAQHTPAQADPAPPAPETVIPGWKAEDERVPPAQFDERYGPAENGSGAGRWFLSLGVGVLLGALAVQSAYIFRQEITRNVPAVRPLYVAACAQFGCDLPLPRDAGKIGIETSDLQSEPALPGRFVLNATIRNRAAYPQAWPHLELTLTDERDRPVVRRVLDPYEWAHAETAKLRAGLPGGREEAVRLQFDAPNVEAVGYRLYVFYP